MASSQKIILNADGSVKLTILGNYIQKGNDGVDEIYIGVVALPSSVSGVANFELPNGDVNTIAGVYQAQISDGQGSSYKGFKFTLTQAQTLYVGDVKMSLQLTDANSNVLYSYSSVLTINPAVMTPSEQQITQAQWNSLVSSLAGYQLQYAQPNVRGYNSLADAQADITNLATNQIILYKDNNEWRLGVYNGTSIVSITTLSDKYLPLSGGTLTNGSFNIGKQLWTGNELISSPVNSRILVNDATGEKLIEIYSNGELAVHNVADPVANKDASNKQYVDTKIANLPVDTTPTINSTNFITSGAVYNEQTSRENADTTLQNNITTLNVYTDDTKATKIYAEYFSDNGLMRITLRNKAGTIISSSLVDLPLELIVVSGSYDSATQELVLVLANGSEIRIPVASMLTNVVQTTNGLVANNLVKATDTHNVEDSGIAFSEVADKTYVGSKIGSIHKIDFNATRSGTVLTGNATAYALSDLVVGNLYSIDISYAISEPVVDSDSVVLKLSDGVSINIYNPLNTSGICKVGDLKQVQFPYSTQTGHRWIFHALLVKTGTNYFFGIVPSVSQQSILAVDNNFLLNVSGESIDLFPYNDGQLFYCMDDGGYEMGHTYKASFNYVSNLVVLSDITVEVPNIMISITHADLLAKVEAGTLIAGQQYRITDYNCSTSTIDTQSAGHQFDIIVMADDEKTLNENARAILHDGDTYFANAKLSAWKLKYSIVNDTTRFAWAVSTGKGVIYQMIDEWNNECPYDFKNIQFIRKLTNGVLDLVGGVDTWVYTFNAYDIDNSNILDGSLLNGLYQIDDADIICKNNTIKSYNREDMYNAVIRKQELNDIVFLNTYSLDEGTYFECYSNSFGNGCYSNTFGTNCYFNTFGNGCYSNTFGTECYNNTFGTECYKNTFGDSCSGNTFGTICRSNIFGDICYNNTFGTNCSGNTFGSGCYSNTFGNVCQYNKITGGSVRYLNLDNGIQGASATNQLELYDLEIVGKAYQVSVKIAASGRYLMLWATDTGAMTGKYKALNTDETWTAL